jgi:predicted transcriptional regulator of viral defense system
MPGSTEDRLFKLAADNDGFFAMRDATAIGIDPTSVLKLLRRGRLERRFRAVYRLSRQ